MCFRYIIFFFEDMLLMLFEYKYFVGVIIFIVLEYKLLYEGILYVYCNFFSFFSCFRIFLLY